MSATSMIPAAPVKNLDVARRLGARRRFMDKLVRLLCIAAMLAGLFFLASILFTLLWRGIPALDLHVFTTEFQPTTYGDDTALRGGLMHAITGSLIQVVLATLIGTPIGLLV